MVGFRARVLIAAMLYRFSKGQMEEWESTYRRLDTNRDGVIDIAEAKRGGISEEHLRYYDTKAVDGVLDINEVVSFSREMRLYKRADFTGPDPKGHLQRLGSHAPPGAPPDEFKGPEEFPHPREFWKEYIQKHKVAVFRGANVRGHKLWTEQLLREKYGWADVKIEPKNESRLEKGAYSDIEGPDAKWEHHRTNIAGIIDNPGKNIYAITILPQAMAWDFDLPWSLLCGSRTEQYNVRSKRTESPHPYPHPTGRSYMTHMLEANLWIAKGFTRSQLHYDKENIFFCCMDCVKDFILVDTRKYGHKIPWARGGKYSSANDLENQWTDWVTVDPERVDMRLYTFLRDIEYMTVRINPGDCIFMPYSMLHQVTTFREEAATNPDKLQSAISVMFDPTEVYDEQACQEYDGKAHLRGQPIPFGAFDLLWYYDGTGIIPQGYPLPHHEVQKLKDYVSNRGKGLTKKLHRKAVQEMSGEAMMLQQGGMQEVDAFTDEFSLYAKDKKAGLQPEEMHFDNTPLELWLKYSARIDGGLPCDHGQLYSPRTPDVWKEMEDVLMNLDRGLPAFSNSTSKHQEL